MFYHFLGVTRVVFSNLVLAIEFDDFPSSGISMAMMDYRRVTICFNIDPGKPAAEVSQT